MATLLTLVQDFCEAKAIASPSQVVTSVDAQVKQIKRLIQEGCEEATQDGAWQELQYEAAWTTLGTESQGTIASIATNGFGWFVQDTFYDRTNKRELIGPRTPGDWQILKASVVAGPFYSFRVRGNEFLVNPAPTAGWTWVFEYQSKNFILAADGVTYKAAFTADDDTILLPYDVVKADLRWRWLKEKGLNYAEEFNTFQRMKVNAVGRSGPKPRLYMHTVGEKKRPFIVIPEGDWPL